MLPEYMTVGELESELDKLKRRRAAMASSEVPDDDWDEVGREIQMIEELLQKKRSL